MLLMQLSSQKALGFIENLSFPRLHRILIFNHFK